MLSLRTSAPLPSTARVSFRAAFAFAVIPTLLAAHPAFAKSDVVVPDWVSTAAAASLPTYPADTKAVVLLDDTTLNVTAAGRASEHHRRVVRILRPKGREDAEIGIPFTAETRISDIHVWSIGPDGHQYALKDKDIAEFGSMNHGTLYYDMRYRVAQAPGSDPGGVVAVEYDQKLPDYLNETEWSFQEDIPILATSYAVNLPPGFTYSSTFAHHAPVTATDLEHGAYRWQLSNVPAVDLRDLSFTPAAHALAGRMAIHYNGPGVSNVGDTWPAIGAWYAQLASTRLQPSPEIIAKANALSGGQTDFYSKVEPIAEFVQQQVRYFVVERGIGGHQPHPAADIFRNRYGDCKDKSTLLASMLEAVGVHVSLVLVDSHRGFIDPEAPSIFGNHMISAIEIPAGYNSPKLRSVVTLAGGKRFLIFDPTWDKTPFGQLENNLQGSYAVIADGSSSQIVKLPVLAPDLNHIYRSGSLTLSEEGTLKGGVTEKLFGDSAEDSRYLDQALDDTDRRRWLDEQLARDLPQFSLSDLKLENVGSLNKDLTTSFQISSEHFAKSTGNLIFVRPRVLGSEHIIRLLHDRAHRPDKLSFDLRETLESKDDFTIDLPAGYAADELPEPVNLDLGFAAYTSSTTLVGHTLHFTRTYVIRELTVAPDRGSDLHKLAETIATDEQSTAVLKKL